MSIAIRPLTAADVADVLALNQEVVHKLAPMDEATYHWFLDVAAEAWAAELDGRFAGFVLLLGPGLEYASGNYRWFSARYESFLYLDRVAVHADARRQGVGSAIYEAVEARAAEAEVPVLLEVNVVPRNDASLAFHAGRGFHEVGTLAHPGDKVVSLMAKEVAPR